MGSAAGSAGGYGTSEKQRSASNLQPVQPGPWLQSSAPRGWVKARRQSKECTIDTSQCRTLKTLA